MQPYNNSAYLSLISFSNAKLKVRDHHNGAFYQLMGTQIINNDGILYTHFVPVMTIKPWSLGQVYITMEDDYLVVISTSNLLTTIPEAQISPPLQNKLEVDKYISVKESEHIANI